MQNVTISWGREIPRIVKQIRDGIIYFLGACLPFAAVLSARLHVTIEEFSAFCGFGIVGAKFIAKLFGVPEDDQQTLGKK